MNTFSHVLMGKFLCRYVRRHYKIKLDEKSFILGNVLPDYYPTFLTRPHFLKNNEAHVQNLMALLMEQNPTKDNGKRYSRLLGILCHFFADFFCYAHSADFSKSLQAHMQYEKRLHRHFQTNLKSVCAVRFIAQPLDLQGADDLYLRFSQLHAGYLLSHASLGNDLMYTILACIDLIVFASGLKGAEKAKAGLCPVGDLQAV